MAKVFLNSGESFTLANSAEVYGAAGTGTEKVLLTGAATAITTDQNIERVELSGNVSAYTFQVVGNQVKVYSGTTLVTTIGVQGDADGTKVAFADGSADLKITGLNAATLGGQAVSSASATAITGATLNATDKSATAGSTSTTPGVGQAFTLTASTLPDTPTLTTGNDTITGAAGTFGSSDVLADPSATDNDTLNAVLTTSLATAPTVSNIENINLDFKGFGIKYNAGSTSNGKITASTTLDGNTVATLQNVGATTKVAAGSGVSTLNLESSGTTLNLTGGQTLTVNNATGGGTIALVSNGSSANTITYDGSVGKTIAVSGSQSLTIKTADLGDFSGNTVTKSLTGDAKFTLELAAAASADLSKVAADSFNINVAGTQNLGLSSGSNVTLSKDLGVTATLKVGTLAVDSAIDVLNLKVAAAQAAVITLDQFETTNLAVTATTPITLAGLTVTDAASRASTINLTGSQDTTITVLTGHASTPTTLNASDFGGKLTVSGVVNAVTIIGGAGADTIIGGGSADLIVGGAGNDTIFTGTSAAVTDIVLGGAGNDVINLGYVTTTANTTALTGAFSVNGGDGVDTLNVTLTAASDHVMTGKVTNVEFINVDATTATKALTWTTVDSDLAASSTLTLNFTGDASKGYLVFDGSAETDGTFNINAAAVFTATDATNMSSIKTGTGNDTITLTSSAATGTLASVITGGKGVDTITLGNSATATVVFAAGDSGITVATADVVNGANADDRLQFTSVSATAATSAFATGSQLGTGWSVSTKGIATKTNGTLDDFITAAAAAGKAGATGMNGQVAAFVSGADTYVFYAGTDTASNTDDGLIKLTGLAVTDLTGSYATAVFTLV